ncbi:MAG: hypothetical protein II735_01850 [Clostridia bacterium]|nr:hypothetical protein [Clostridia bacterium]
MKKLSGIKLLLAAVMLVLVTVALVCTVTRKKLSKTTETFMTVAEWVIGTFMTVFKLKELQENNLLEEAVDEIREEEF